MKLAFALLKDEYSIYRLEKDSAIPDWIDDSEFFSVTRTQDELSIVCKHVELPSDNKIQKDEHWRILRINGTLDLSLIGIIAGISSLFKGNKISIFIISTYDTDYILVKNSQLDKAMLVLTNYGHKLFIED